MLFSKKDVPKHKVNVRKEEVEMLENTKDKKLMG